MATIKTTITIDRELWNEFSILVIKRQGLRKKNEVIESLIKDYISRVEK